MSKHSQFHITVGDRQMNRRLYIKAIFGAAVVAITKLFPYEKSVAGQKSSILLQNSPVAGFQFYEGEQVWQALCPGQRLQLVREPDNEYDSQAVQVLFQDRQIGYLPRAENNIIAQMMDRGEKVYAKVGRLQHADDPWERVEVAVYLDVVAVV